jgi:hypothetical protein
VLRRILGPKRAEGCRKLGDEGLHNLYSAPSIIRMIKSKRIRLAGNVVRMRKEKNTYRILVGKQKEDVDLSESVILKWILESRVG